MVKKPSAPAAEGDKDETTDKTKKPAVKKTASSKKKIWKDEVINVDIVDEKVEKARIKRVLRVIQMQIVVIAGLGMFFLFAGNFFQPQYQYYAMDSGRREMRLMPLSMPNMTNQAVLSWSTNSITEIMTFGFGDYLPHLRDQQARFTREGWKAFVSAFDKMNLGETFRERQLVLTTVPSDTAVIISQGPNQDGSGYEWKVQVPVVMTYATNDNVTHRDKAIVELVITRVPSSQSPNGIAIKSWTLA